MPDPSPNRHSPWRDMTPDEWDAATPNRSPDPGVERQARIEAERALNRLVPLLPSTARVHDDYNTIRAALAALPHPEPSLDPERLATVLMAVDQVRSFLLLHRRATGRSDVNIRKVVALLDNALTPDPTPRP